MSKVERERKQTCKKCFEEIKCVTRWGKSCNRNGGKKIPKFRNPKHWGFRKPVREETIRVVSGW